MKIKSCDLIGPALDWAVAQADGWCVAPNYFDIPTLARGSDRRYAHQFKYSTDWSQGGPIIEKNTIRLWATFPSIHAPVWYASANEFLPNATGATALIAAMRAYVAAKLGDTVEIPPQLVEG